MAGTSSVSLKSICFLLLILALAAAVRLPFFLHAAGQLDSDDAVMGLMGKHISEGKTPAVYMYGQDYIGSLSSHVYAIFFFIFGHSPVLLGISAFLFFIGFLVVQHFLLRSVFSKPIAWMATLFLSLPLGSLVEISLDNSGGFSLVIFLGSAVAGLAHVVACDGRERWLGPLAFLMGLAFWTHQMTLPFLLTAGVLLVFRYRLRVRIYLQTALWFAIGAFPFILYGAFTGFKGLGHLFSGEKMVFSADRFLWFLRETGKLLASRHGFRVIVVLLLLLVGLAYLIWESLKKRRSPASLIYALFLAIFLAIYFTSAFSGAFRPRYLCTLYFALPVLFLAPLQMIKARLPRTGSYILLALLLLVPDGWSHYLDEVKDSASRDVRLYKLVEGMSQTGQRYWLSDYWNAYLLTALSGEKLIVCPLTVKRYRPYELEYHNTLHPTNYLFGLDTPENEFNAGTLRKQLKRLDLAFKGRKVFDYVLTYDVSSWVPPYVLSRSVPERPPELIPQKIIRSPYRWSLECRVRPSPEQLGLSGGLEIPGACSVSSLLVPEQETNVLDFPLPPQSPERAHLLTNFAGIPLKDTVRILDLDGVPFVNNDASPGLVPVSGLSSPLVIFTREGRLCSRIVEFQLPAGPDAYSSIRLRLFSPFSFRAVSWHGLYEQAVEISVAGVPLGTYRLEDGDNDIILPLKTTPPAAALIALKLAFRYETVLDNEPLGFMKISALLTEADVVR